MIDVNAP